MPKKHNIFSFIYNQPVAITCNKEKSFEKLVRALLTHSFDNQQCTYRAIRSTEDTIDTATLRATVELCADALGWL